MATVKPTLSLVSSDAFTDSLSLSLTKSISVGSNSEYGKILVAGSGVSAATFAANADYGQSLVYLKNLSDAATASTKAAAIDGVEIYQGSTKVMELSAGEFALFPWDGAADLKQKHNGNGNAPKLEFAVFEFAT